MRTFDTVEPGDQFGKEFKLVSTRGGWNYAKGGHNDEADSDRCVLECL